MGIKAIIIVVILLLILLISVIILKELLNKKSESAESYYRVNKKAYVIISKFLNFQKFNFRSKSFLAYGIANSIIDEFDPKNIFDKKINKEFDEAAELVAEAKEYAIKKSSQEAIDYVLECEEDLKQLRFRIDSEKGITKALKVIDEIKSQLKQILEQDEFEDSGETNKEETNEQTINYYQILGVKKESTFDEIKESFKELIKKYHPDKYEHLAEEYKLDAEKKMKLINEAYSVLSNDNSRKNYDKTI